MYLDNSLTFCSAQAITASAASTNILDFGTNIQDQAEGRYIESEIIVNQAFNNLTSLAISLQSAVVSAFTTPIESWTKTFLLAALTANTILPTPKIADNVLEFVRLYFTVTGTAPTTGTVTGYLLLDQQNNIPTLGLPNS